METLFLLATVMALFGVLGYLRGTRAMLYTTAVLWLGLLMLSRAGRLVATLVNGLNFAVRFVFAGGLQALTAENRGAALDAAIQQVGDVTPLIIVNDAGTATGPGVALILVLLILLAILPGALKILRGKRSLLGLFLGLLDGYVLTAFSIRTLLSGAPVQLSLPAWLFGPSFATPVATMAPAGTSLLQVAWAQLINFLNRMAEQGTLGLLFAVLIAVFVLVATRLGNRSERRG